MKYFVDGDQLCITNDDFVDLQESPAVFYPLTGEIAQTVLADGIRGLPVGYLISIRNRLMREMLLGEAAVEAAVKLRRFGTCLRRLDLGVGDD